MNIDLKSVTFSDLLGHFMYLKLHFDILQKNTFLLVVELGHYIGLYIQYSKISDD